MRLHHTKASLERTIAKDLPRCLTFVSRFCGVDVETIRPRNVEVVDGVLDDRGMIASVCPSTRKMVFSSLLFSRLSSLDVRASIVHELTHMAVLELFERRDACTATRHPSFDYVNEGIARLLEREFYRTETLLAKLLDSIVMHFFSYPKLAPDMYSIGFHDQGRRFISALYDGGFSVGEIIDIVGKSPPSERELLFPRRYLRRRGIEYAPNDLRPDEKKMGWVDHAIKLGVELTEPKKQSIWQCVIEEDRSIRSELYEVAYSHFHRNDRTGVPRNALPPASIYGIEFIECVIALCDGKRDRLIRMLEVFPLSRVCQSMPPDRSLPTPREYIDYYAHRGMEDQH